MWLLSVSSKDRCSWQGMTSSRVTAFRKVCCDPAARTDEQPMSLFRTAARRDKSEAAIVQALRQLGWSVLQVNEECKSVFTGCTAGANFKA
jgi:transposase